MAYTSFSRSGPDDATGAAPTITSGKWWAKPSNGFAYRGMEYDDKWSYLKFQDACSPPNPELMVN